MPELREKARAVASHYASLRFPGHGPAVAIGTRKMLYPSRHPHCDF